MAIIKVEEHTCDICGRSIPLADVYLGALKVRKRGARGIAREITLSLHQKCIPTPMIPGAAPKPNGRPAQRSRVAAKA